LLLSGFIAAVVLDKAADHHDVFISRIFRLLRAAVHGKAFGLRQNDVVLKIRVDVGLYIFGVAP